MKVTTLHNPAAGRGGMCSNAFGGHHRLDKCDLMGPSLLGDVLVDVVSGASPERMIWLTSIKDAVQNYLPWGLGKNGTTDDEFWFACEYLFNVRASESETWANAPRNITQTYHDESLSRRVTRKVELSEIQVKAMCIDVAWDHLAFPVTLDAFCDELKEERLKIVRKSWGQIRAFLNLPGSLETWKRALVCPSEPEDVERLLSYRRKRKATVLQMASFGNPVGQRESAPAEEAA